jgi:hypothetical protein
LCVACEADTRKKNPIKRPLQVLTAPLSSAIIPGQHVYPGFTEKFSKG